MTRSAVYDEDISVLTGPGGSELTLVLVIVTDGTTNYTENFTYEKDNTDSLFVSNLQTCIGSITSDWKKGGTK